MPGVFAARRPAGEAVKHSKDGVMQLYCSALRTYLPRPAILVAAIAVLLTVATAAQSSGSEFLRLETTAAGADTVVYQGDQAELKLTLSSISDEPVGPVIIVVESRGGVVEIVRDKSIRWQGKGGAWSGRLNRLGPGAALPFTIKLNYAPSILDSTAKLVDGKLTVTASVEGETPAEHAQIERAWIMGNCAGAYRAALDRVSSEHNEPLKDTIKSVHGGWRSLPGRWLFPPARAGYDRTLRRIVYRATPLVRYRGVDPRLRLAVKTREVARTARELDLYVNQTGGPALCTGAPEYMSFFEQRLETFRGQHDAVSQLFERAAQIADWKLLDAETAMAAPLEVPEDGEDEDLTDHAHRLAVIVTHARRTWTTIVDGDAAARLLPEHMKRLEHIRTALGEVSVTRRSPLRGRKAAAQTALTAIEALAYIRGSYAKHDEIVSGFEDLIGAVRSAHAENCVCSRQ